MIGRVIRRLAPLLALVLVPVVVVAGPSAGSATAAGCGRGGSDETALDEAFTGPGLGATAVVAAVKLWSGQPWARTYLEIFFWFVTLAVIGNIGYEGARIKEMATGNVIRGALYFFFLGLPPMILAVVLRNLPR